MMRDIDLTKPSRPAAFLFAKLAGLASAKAAGRLVLNADDKAVASREFARLLWHVPVDAGGLLGADDADREEICSRDPILRTLAAKAVMAAIWDSGEWPKSEFATYLEWERAQISAAPTAMVAA